MGNCGDGGTDMSTYYLICVRCRDMYMENCNQSAKASGSKEASLKTAKDRHRRAQRNTPNLPAASPIKPQVRQADNRHPNMSNF